MKFKDDPNLQLQTTNVGNGAANNGANTSNESNEKKIIAVLDAKPVEPDPKPKEEPKPVEPDPKPKEEPKQKNRTPIYWGASGVLFSLTLLFLALAYKSAKS